MKKNGKRLIKTNLEQKKYLKEKVTYCMPNGKGLINSWTDKKDLA